MRVLHVIHSVDPLTGGPAAALGLYIESLLSVGVESVVASSDGAGLDRHSWARSDRVRVFHAYPPQGFGFSPGMLNEVVRRSPKPDVIHAHGLWMFPSVAAAIGSSLRNIPLVVRPCGALTTLALGRRRIAKAAYYRVVETHVIRRASVIHFTTEWEMEEASRSLGALAGRVIPVPVSSSASMPREAARRELGIPPDSPLLLCVGRLHSIKRNEILLEALAMDPGSSLLALVGPDGGERQMLHARARQLGLEHRVFMPGLASQERLELWHSAADLFTTASSHENFGLAIAQACQAGLPCVIPASLGIARELSGAILTVDDGPDAFVGAWRRVLSEPGLGRTLSATGVERARALWGHEAIGKRLLQMYELAQERLAG